MLRKLFHSFALLVLAAPLAAQTANAAFVKEFDRSFEYKDTKAIDRAVRKSPDATIRHYQNLLVDIWTGKKELVAKTDLLEESFKRCFEGCLTLEKVKRWVQSQDQRSYETYQKYLNNQYSAWLYFQEETKKHSSERKPFEQSRDAFMEVAKQLEQIGHKLDAAATWGMVANSLDKIPDEVVEDSRDMAFALEQFLALRDSWAWTYDTNYQINKNQLKALRGGIAKAEADTKKREAEGYGSNVRGVDGLVMPGVEEVSYDLEFKMLSSWDDELDYCQQAGPLPQYWWKVAFGKDVKSQPVTWFRRPDIDLHVVRESVTKFGVTTVPSDPNRTQSVDVSGKAEPTMFYLDVDKTIPYAMFFWSGSDQELIGEAQVNLAPSTNHTGVHYCSAASWQVTVDGEKITYYDDNSSGLPMDADPADGEFPMYTLGVEKGEAPLLDSMRIGGAKSKRVPFSEFVKVGENWHYIQRTDKQHAGSRPLNPDYFKTGKVKLAWKGSKGSVPAQLVIQGHGDYKTACFDIAGGKEVEVPAGQYSVIWGRIVKGKGSRIQMASIFQGKSEPFAVEPGETLELKMGAPFVIEFERSGSGKDLTIDATRITLRDSSGCTISEMHGCSLVPEVMAAKTESGKGAKRIAKFTKYTDAEMLNKTATKLPNLGLKAACFPLPQKSRDGSMTLKASLPSTSSKVGLSVKKHPLFGKLKSDWK